MKLKDLGEFGLIGRIGGDEFTALTMETSPDSSDLLIERLCENIEKKNRDENDARALSVTVGVSRYDLNGGDSITRLIDRADQDMYAKKRSKFA